MTPTSYTTIEEIQLRKAMLQTEIQKDSNKLSNEWSSLFKKPEALDRKASPTKRFNSLLSTGAGLFDQLQKCGGVTCRDNSCVHCINSSSP